MGPSGSASTTASGRRKGLYVGPSMWRTMEWIQPDSLLLVFASQVYREEDYIRDYEGFLSFAREKAGKEGTP